MSILIKNVTHGKEETHIYIEENIIKEIGKKLEADRVIDGKGKAILPGLINTHTHAAMTLFRGYADDLPLHEWLEEKIWPVEAKLTEEDSYWGTKLACLEMIKSGTTTFNDMYFFAEANARAVIEMGIRGCISGVFADIWGSCEEWIKKAEKVIRKLIKLENNRIIPALGPHAVYTVSKEGLQWVSEFSEENDLLIHFHLAETEKENEDFFREKGKRPVKYLEEIGFLTEKLVAAHCVWLTPEEIRTLADHGVKISHNPVSNMKLAVGGTIPYASMKEAGLTVSLGTDGCASNNNLDMFESMKFAALAQKAFRNDPTALSALQAYEMATSEGAKALRIDAGKIEEGKLADVILIDLKRPELTPNHELISNLVYSANGSCVDTVICDGKILMENRRVDGEEEIMEMASKRAMELVRRE
ncbi:MAG: amidohydrolase [Candidatus Syntropharchaeia archaeon]